MTENEDFRPFCHNEPMQPSYRYGEKGHIFRVFVCYFCNNKTEVEIE